MAKEKKRVGCLGVVGILLAVGFVGSLFTGGDEEVADRVTSTPSSPATQTPETTETKSSEPLPPEPETFLEAGQLDNESFAIIAGQTCPAIEQILSESPLNESATTRTEALADLRDAYDADDYVQSNSWVRPLVTADIEDQVSSAFRVAFDAMLGASAFDGADELKSNYPSTYLNLLSDFETAVLEECELAETLTAQEALSRQVNRVVNLANNVPWYPKGFTEYEDGLTAWDWADRSCSYYSGRCSHMDVVTWIGCPNLYVEVNFLDSSNSVIDWSNDTARGLRAGDRAKLEFVSFDDNARSTRLVEISCY